MKNAKFWCASRIFKIFILFLIYLLFLFLRFYQTKPPDYPVGKEIILSGILTEEPQVKGKIQKFSFKSVPITTWNLPEFHYGDELKIVGSITEERRQQVSFWGANRVSDSRIRTDSGSHFAEASSDKQARMTKIYRSMLFPKITVLGHKEGVILGRISVFRQKIISFYARSLHEPAASLLTGIVLGVKTTLPNDFYTNLKITGTMHVVAASGMNVSIVAGFLMAIFSKYLGRRNGLIFSSIGILFYAALSGFSPSINRAAIMGLLYFLSSYLGRQNFGLLSLGLASTLMIFVHPYIVTDIGFQLSIMATLGLMVIQPRLGVLGGLGKLGKIPFFGEALLTTLAAQIATLPILLVNFGNLSFWSPLVNALVLWTIEPITVFGGIGAIGGIISEPLGRIFVYLTYGFLVLFIEIVNFFGRIQLFSFTFENVPILFGVGWYLMVGGLLLFSYRHPERSEGSLANASGSQTS